MYKDAEYARSRLQGTIVLHGSIPVYVEEVEHDMTCIVRIDIDSNQVKPIPFDDLNVLAPKLGYVNLQGKAHYVSRKPLRNDWRQGLRPSQCVILNGKRGVVGGHVSHSMIIDCIKGEFPSKRKALAMMKEGWKSVALSREFCLHRDDDGAHELHYTWHGKVGVMKGKDLTLDDGNEHLEYLLGDIK